MKKLNDFLNDYKDYKKIMHTAGSLIKCILYNPNTKKVVSFVVDDYEYTYGEGLINRDYDLETLEYIRYNMQIDSEALKHYEKHVLKVITEGSGEVIKNLGLQLLKIIYVYCTKYLQQSKSTYAI